ncbi:MAG: hypothetical protein LBU65_13500 [Planctomycetaceae bacterium]|nr:hypothetical protein [Planctomycetaceae bacterium]
MYSTTFLTSDASPPLFNNTKIIFIVVAQRLVKLGANINTAPEIVFDGKARLIMLLRNQ